MKPEYIYQVVILDDNVENADLLKDYLAIHKITAKQFYFPFTFLNAVQSGLKTKVLLLDIQMPVIDGLTLLSIMKSDHLDFLQNTKIIALTALAMKNDENRCLAAGADYYLSKPFSLNILKQQITSLLQ